MYQSKILWTDEKKFVLNQSPNRQNVRHWSVVNPHNVLECRVQGTPSITAFVALIDNKIIGPYWFMNENRNRTTVNADRYKEAFGNAIVP